MNSKTKIIIRLIASILITAFAFGLYSRLPGTENIRSIHVMTLIVTGMGIGLFLTNFFLLVKTGKTEQSN